MVSCLKRTHDCRAVVFVQERLQSESGERLASVCVCVTYIGRDMSRHRWTAGARHDSNDRSVVWPCRSDDGVLVALCECYLLFGTQLQLQSNQAYRARASSLALNRCKQKGDGR